MAVVLALVAAVCFGAGDFSGGIASRRTNVLRVVAVSHIVGLLGVAAIAPATADAFSWRDLGIGAVGGLFGLAGIVLLYRGLARGPMSVVAPLTALTSAAVPSAWGLASGEELSLAAGLGALIGLFAIVLVSSTDDGSHAPVTGQVIVEALLAGVGFGMFFVLLDAAADDTAPWPVVGARLATTALLLLVLAVRRMPVRADRTAMGLIVLAGLLDVGANVSFLLAANEGLLTLTAVLSSLYPVVTVLLARLVLHERMTQHQVLGFGAATLATVLIAAG